MFKSKTIYQSQEGYDFFPFYRPAAVAEKVTPENLPFAICQ